MQDYVKTIRCKRASTLRRDTALIHRLLNRTDRFPFCIALINLLNERSRDRVDLKILVLIHIIPKRNRTTIIFAFQRIFCQPSPNLDSKLHRIIFIQALQQRFQQNPFRSIRNRFHCRNHIDTIFT